MMQKKGFTLVELLVTIVIIALLGGVGVIGFSNLLGGGVNQYYRTLESSILLAGNDYFLDHRDELPDESSLSEVSLTDLIEGKYIEPVKDSKGNLCSNGKVYAYRENNKYNYETCLICDDGYQTQGTYCSGGLNNAILVSAVTKTTHEQRDVTVSYNSVIPALRENVLEKFSLRDNNVEVSRYDVISEKNNVQVPCSVSDNICTADIGESGTYTVTAYDANDNKIASRKINVRIVMLQDGYINLSERNGSADYGTTSKTVTVTNHHGGKLSVTDDNETASCYVSGTTITCSDIEALDAGTNINVIVKSSETGEYAEASAYYTLTIARAAGSFSCANKTFNGSSQTACTCSGGSLSGTYSATNYSSSAYTAYCTPDNNHTINGSTARQTRTWSMAKKTLTITASNQNVKVGSTISTGTDKVTQSGLASGDSITGVTLKASRTTAGKGTITPSDLKTSKGDSNYNITYKTGTLIMYNVTTKTVKGNSNSGTATFSDISVSTIVSSSVSKNTSPTLSCTKSGTTVTCNISNMTRKTADDDETCLIATKHLIHSSITGSNIEAFYGEDGSSKYCYYRAGSSPTFSGNDWICGTKTNPLDGNKKNHCPNNSDNCHASSCWNAVKFAYSSSGNKCKCWGRTTTRTYYSEKIILHWY